jgi:hypothetical protein
MFNSPRKVGITVNIAFVIQGSPCPCERYTNQSSQVQS